MHMCIVCHLSMSFHKLLISLFNSTNQFSQKCGESIIYITKNNIIMTIHDMATCSLIM